MCGSLWSPGLCLLEGREWARFPRNARRGTHSGFRPASLHRLRLPAGRAALPLPDLSEPSCRQEPLPSQDRIPHPPTPSAPESWDMPAGASSSWPFWVELTAPMCLKTHLCSCIPCARYMPRTNAFTPLCKHHHFRSTDGKLRHRGVVSLAPTGRPGAPPSSQLSGS